jgi:hypothetical protein
MGSLPSSFANVKDLRFVITLKNGNAFSSSGGQSSNTITLQGLRASVYIDNAGGAMMGTLRAQVFGVTASDMNRLTSTLWDALVVSPAGSSFAFNTIQVFAIDGTQQTLVYNGDILNCWGVYTSMPNTYLYIEALIGYSALVQPVDPLSIAADTDVGTVMKGIAGQMGYQFENNGVNTTVAKGSYWGNTLMEQARALMQAYRFWMYLDSNCDCALWIGPQCRRAVDFSADRHGRLPCFQQHWRQFRDALQSGAGIRRTYSNGFLDSQGERNLDSGFNVASPFEPNARRAVENYR